MTTPSPVLSDTADDSAAPPSIYLDNAATTPPRPQTAEAVQHGLELFGNPSSNHTAGERASDALDLAREQIATLLGCSVDETVMTGCGSEAINTALFGVLAARGFTGHIIVSAIEHAAVLQAANALAGRGVDVTVLPVTSSGHVEPAAVAQALRGDTVLVSVMHANNETGTIQPVEDVTRLVHAHGALTHIDAVQTAGKLPVGHLAADLVSVSAHKFGGPKGVGALKVASHVELEPLLHGGGQERGRRAGTENTPGILGMGAAASAALTEVDSDSAGGACELREVLLRALAPLGGVDVNGDAPALPTILNVSIAGVRGDTLVELLDLHGVRCSTGSACHAADESPSHVLSAMGAGVERAHGAVRFSAGEATTPGDVEEAARRVARAVEQLRHVSPHSAPVETAR